MKKVGNAKGTNGHAGKTLKARERTGRELVVSLKGWSEESGFPYSTVRDLVINGTIPALKIGKHYYIRRADGLRWIDSNVRKQAS